MNKYLISKNYPLYFLVPIIIVFTVFFIAPAFLGLALSLTDSSIRTSGASFVGLENYRMLFSDGDVFLTSILNQFKFALIVTVSKTFIGLLLALLLNEKFMGRNALRALVYLPIMFSTIVVGLVFNYILRYEGFVNGVLKSIGLGFAAQDWLGNFDLALYTVAGVDTWVGVGWTVLIILAALQSIPKEVIECSDIDGAGAFRKFTGIKLPFIWHAINLCFLLTLISGLKAFDIIYALTGGGPGHATEVMTTFLVKSMSSGSIGYPAAINFCQFVIITAVALIVNKINSRREAVI